MIRRSTRYDLAKLGWGVLSVGGAVFLYSGQAAPTVTPAQLPGEPFHGLVAGVALAAVGVLLVSVRETGAWKAAGRRAGLSPDGGGLFGRPDLAGTVDGRTVRVRTVKRRTGSSNEGGSSKTTYTVVEAELDRPAEEGLIVTPASGGQTVSTSASYRIDADRADVADEELAAVGGPEDVARAVVSGRAREPLVAVDDLVYVGDAAGALKDATGDVSGSRIGSWIQGEAADRVPGDPSVVSVETKGLVLSGDRLREQAEAVVATADAFEDATGR